MKSQKRASGRIQRAAKSRPALSDFGKLVLQKRLEVEPSAEETVEESLLLGRLRREPLAEQDLAVLRYAYRLRRLDVDPATLLREQWEAEKRFSMFLEKASDFARVPEFVHDGDRDPDIHGFFDPLNSPTLRAIFHAFRTGAEASPRSYTKRGRDLVKGLHKALWHSFPTGKIRRSDEDKKRDEEEKNRLNALGRELVEKYGGDKSQAASEFLRRRSSAPGEVAQRSCDAVRHWQEMKEAQSNRKARRESGEDSVRSSEARREAAYRAEIRRFAPWLIAKTH